SAACYCRPLNYAGYFAIFRPGRIGGSSGFLGANGVKSLMRTMALVLDDGCALRSFRGDLMALPVGVVRRWVARQLPRVMLAKMRFSRMAGRPVMVPLQRDGLDPVAELGRWRREDPVARLTGMFGRNVWLVSGYEQACSVLADHHGFSNDIRSLVGRADATGVDAIGGLGSTDAPDHTRLRRLLTPEFTMRRLRELEPRVCQIVDEQLEVVESAGPGVDLVRS